MKRARQPCVALIGSCDPQLASVMEEVVGELGATVDRDLVELSPALVIAVMDAGDVVQVLTAARLLAGPAPVVGVTGIADERLIGRALAAGATACHTLDSPLEQLRGLLRSLLPGGAP